MEPLHSQAAFTLENLNTNSGSSNLPILVRPLLAGAPSSSDTERPGEDDFVALAHTPTGCCPRGCSFLIRVLSSMSEKALFQVPTAIPGDQLDQQATRARRGCCPRS